MFRKMTRWMVPLVVLPLFMVACDDDGTSARTAEVSLLLTDALGDHVDNVWVGVGEVYLQGTGGRVPLYDVDEDPDVAEEDKALGKLVELTALGGDPDIGTDGVALELVSGKEVPPGSYGQLRFVIRSGVLESGDDFWVYNGAEVPEDHDSRAAFEASTPGTLNCPSCTQTGIKALLPQDEAQIEAGSQIIVLDFDVGRSFGREAGMSGQWVMTPIIVATQLEFSGAISGTVAFQQDGEGNITATLPTECPAGTTVDATVTREMIDVFEVTANDQTDDVDPVDEKHGTYAFPVLEAGTYTMSFTTPRKFNDRGDGTSDAYSYDVVAISQTSVTLESGTVETVDYEIQEVSCTTVSD